MLEVNEYVRTKDGHIAKYIEKLVKDEDVSDGILFDGYIYEKHKHIRYSFLKEIIVKHSKQLIDLVEVGDYVNGKYVQKIKSDRNGKYILALIGIIEEQDIKTILTKEQFEANCYKVGGEDEEI